MDEDVQDSSYSRQVGLRLRAVRRQKRMSLHDVEVGSTKEFKASVLGAYELGAARALYRGGEFAPDVIAGVSIGAITAVLLARPGGGREPLQTLEAFWDKVTVPGVLFPPQLRPYASFLGNPNFFLPRFDYLALPTWTYFYDTAPLRRTLEELVDLRALADRHAVPNAGHL